MFTIFVGKIIIMKNTFKLLLVSLILVGMTACGGGSKKGAWSDADKDKAKEELKKIDDDLSILGDKKDAFIECYLKKVEENYDSFDAANKDEAGCSKLAEKCVGETMK